MCGVAEAKGHGKVFVEAEGSDDGGFGNVRWMDGNLVVAFDEVQLGEDGGAVETGREVFEVGKRVAVRSCDEVEAAVVATGFGKDWWSSGLNVVGKAVMRRMGL